MLTNSELQEQVKQAIEGPTDPAPVEKIESSPEVKVEVVETPVVETPEVVVDNKPKSEEIVSNLNIALKEEREARRIAETKAEEARLAAQEALEFKKKMEGAFAPPVPVQEKEPETPKYLTAEDVDRLWQEKEQARIEEATNAQKIEAIKQEVSRLETTWDGTNGKPKYDDQAVLTWQSENNKLYLTPEEAFFQMKRNDIIDYEAKQRLSGLKQTPNATQPSSSDVHEPVEIRPKSPQELRNAIYEAISQGDTD